MTATNELLIDFFENEYPNIRDIKQLKLFLKNIVMFSKEIHIQNPNDNEQLANLPLLAIISVVLEDYPNEIFYITENEPILTEALKILINYSDEKRQLLQKHFLNRTS